MGRKIDLKKIDDVTKCQVTFSKRRSGLMKKANEIAICCDVDVAFVAFSPSGRVSKFCNQKRIEDVLHRYVNIPPESRLNHITSVKRKMEKLGQLDHIKSETNKLQYLDKQIENLELQIKKSGLELQILEADLRDYEIDPEQEPSLHHLSWCERNIKNSLQRVIARKNALFGNSSTSSASQKFQMELENQDDLPFPDNLNENDFTLTPQNPSTGHIPTQLDPWISSCSARIHGNVFQDLFNHTGFTLNPEPSNASNYPIQPNICSFSIPQSPVIFKSAPMVKSNDQTHLSQIPPNQPFVLDQAWPDFPQEHNTNVWINIPAATVPNSIQDSAENMGTSQPPRFEFTTTATTTAPYSEPMDPGLQYPDLNLSPLSSIIGEEIGRVNLHHGNNLSTTNAAKEEDQCSKMQTINQHEAPYQVHPPLVEVSQDTKSNNPQPEENLGTRAVWTTQVEKINLWEWEDILLDKNLSLGNISK